jgi:hypothetical protein
VPLNHRREYTGSNAIETVNIVISLILALFGAHKSFILLSKRQRFAAPSGGCSAQ